MIRNQGCARMGAREWKRGGGVCLAGLLLSIAMCSALAFANTAADPRSEEQIDQDFARYVAPARHGLVVDLDMQAAFTADGRSVVYRKGRLGEGQVLLVDLEDETVARVVDDVTLRAALDEADAPGGHPAVVRYMPAAKRLIVSVGKQEWDYSLESGKAGKRSQGPPQRLKSPDDRFSLFVRDYNLWIRDEDIGRESALTADGSFDRRYATNYPRFGQQIEANSELPPMRVEAWWSPDSTHAVTYRLDRNGAPFHEGVHSEPPGGEGPRTFRYLYPNAGDKVVPNFHPLLIDVESRTVRPLDVPPQDMFVPMPPKLSWEGGKVSYRWEARGYGDVKLYEVDPRTGEAQVRVHESLEPNVTVTRTLFRRVPELGGTAVVSERSGWAQLYWVADGDDPRQGRRLTAGDWEVTGLLRAGEEGFLVTGKGREPGLNPYYEHLYRVGLDGTLVRLTPELLDHKVQVPKEGGWFVDSMSSPTEPTRTVVRDVADGRIVFELGRADPWGLLADGFTSPEIFQGLAADGKTVLYGTIFRPPNFDPARSYPVINHVYTGPTRHRFRETYAQNVGGIQSALTRLGAIVVTIDGLGTAGRGRDFRMQAFQNLHAIGVDDHVTMLRQMQQRYPYMDLDRGVGVMGGSAGGYDTFRFMIRRPDIFTAGVSSSGNHQLRQAKVWWPEIHMGLADEATWAANENATYADRLQGKLLLVHGDIDDNVPVRTTLTLSQALTDAGKPHEVLILPNVGHSVTTPEFHRATRRFFMRELIRPESR